jgi:ubiquinone/menaquinone biosynthesis C-methylase UbiE
MSQPPTSHPPTPQSTTPQHTIRFEDGAAYERGMGGWSRLAGEIFLDWLAPPVGLRWIDIGCGNGAFTELLVQRTRPSEVWGIDPSEAQLRFARERPGAQGATFREGDAMNLPFEAGRFDAAVMALVIFFVPDPAKGLAEMMRVVSPGGIVTAYAWDLLEGGFPFGPIMEELRAAGFNPPLPPSAPIARMQALRALWESAGLETVETREIEVERHFADFEDFWSSSTRGSGSIGPLIARMSPEELARLKSKVAPRLSTDAAGRVTGRGRANAITGRLPRRG